MVTIEAASAEDESEILRLAGSAGNFSAEEVVCVQGLWQLYLTEGSQKSGLYFLVYRSGTQLLGFTCYGPHVGASGPYDLFWMAVDPAARRQHIGRQLLDRTLHQIAELGGNLLYIETSGRQDYECTRQFYCACGCVEAAHINDFYEPGESLVIFTKRPE